MAQRAIHRQSPRGRLPVLTAAAVFCGVAAAAGAYAVMSRGEGRGRASSTGTGQGSEWSREVVNTPRGERTQTTLPDGTHVVVAPESRLRIAHSFNDENRRVYLDGNAVFTVAHNVSTPFLVRTKNAEITALGTRFSVRQSVGETFTRVAVADGKVAVQQRTAEQGDISEETGFPLETPSQAILQSGTAATIYFNGMIRVHQHADTTAELGWTRGVLAFNDVPVSTVLNRLNAWYAINLQLHDPTVARRRVTLVLDNLDIAHVVDTLRRRLQVDTLRQGTKLLLVSNASNVSRERLDGR